MNTGRINTNRIEKLLALGQLFFAEATELRNGLPGNGQASRKGLSKEQKTKLISKRFKTAFKNK